VVVSFGRLFFPSAFKLNNTAGGSQGSEGKTVDFSSIKRSLSGTVLAFMPYYTRVSDTLRTRKGR